jgi:hypothetical protein
MRKVIAALIGVVGVIGVTMVFGIAQAADLKNGDGQSCGSATGQWHFVNNQDGGVQTPATLHVVFSNPSSTQDVVADHVLQKVQQWDVTAAGTLVSASTGLAGNLVLSDFSCGSPPPPPPPPLPPPPPPLAPVS